MEVTHLLDYGCGSNLSLVEGLKGKIKHKLTYQAYDPCVPRFAKQPLPAQMVCCIDVLEHIEPEHLEGVLNDLMNLTEGIAFISVFTKPALKVLDDGRNAHLIQEPIEWWLPKLWNRWDLQTVQSYGDGGYYFIGYARTKLEDASGAKLT